MPEARWKLGLFHVTMDVVGETVWTQPTLYKTFRTFLTLVLISVFIKNVTTDERMQKLEAIHYEYTKITVRMMGSWLPKCNNLYDIIYQGDLYWLLSALWLLVRERKKKKSLILACQWENVSQLCTEKCQSDIFVHSVKHTHAELTLYWP